MKMISFVIKDDTNLKFPQRIVKYCSPVLTLGASFSFKAVLKALLRALGGEKSKAVLAPESIHTEP